MYKKIKSLIGSHEVMIRIKRSVSYKKKTLIKICDFIHFSSLVISIFEKMASV